MKFIIIPVLIFLLFSCTSKTEEKPIAKVFESYLYTSEITDFIPHGTPAPDSLLMAQNYIRNWITKKLLLHKAIENLSGGEKDIQKQVDNYRTALLIHQYKQKLIAQRLVEDIKEENIQKYYDENKANFTLPTPIVKAIFLIVPKSASNLNNVKKWYKSDKPQDLESLEEYCITNAKKYDDFDNKWIEVKYLLNLVPGDFNTLESEVLHSKNIEKEDDENYYFLRINEMRREQTTAPLGYVRDEIVLILKNKKKLDFENDLEQQINQEGTRKNYVEIY